MIKKCIKFLLIFLLLLIPNVVFASNDSSDNRHIVSVNKMLIDGAKISVEGYAFISHQDNYGGSDGNIKNFIVVYTGTPQNEKSWQEDYINISNDKSSIECIQSGNCYVLTDDEMKIVSNDLWWARCTGAGCIKQDEITAYRIDNGFMNSSTCKDSEYRVGNSTVFNYGSECIYYNIGFSAELQLDDIILSFLGNNNGNIDDVNLFNSYGETIKFRIVTINKDVLEDSNKGEVGIIDSSLNVHKSVCKYVNLEGNPVSCGDGEQENVSGLYTFKTAKMPNQVIMDANEAIPRLNCEGPEDDKDVCTRLEDKVFASKSYAEPKKQLVYNVDVDVESLGFVETRALKKSVEVDGRLYSETYKDSLYKLKGYEGNDCRIEHVCPQYDGIDSWKGYWSLASWITVAGAFSIEKFKFNGDAIESLECKDITNVSEETYFDETTTCDSSPDANVAFNSCDKLKSIEGIIYYKDVLPNHCNNTQYVEDGLWQYIPIKIQADILVEQEGKFYFSSFHSDIDKISAGKGFSIFERTKGISYDNVVRFIIANKYASGPLINAPYISAHGIRYNNNCEIDTSFNVSQKIKDNYFVTNGVFYYKDESGKFQTSSALNVMLKVIGNSFIENKASNYKNNTDFDENLSDKFKSCDSNLTSISCNKNVNGIWKSIYDDNNGKVYISVDADNNLFKDDELFSPNDENKYPVFGFEYKSSHIYKLPYAYISLGNNYGDIVYSKSELVNPESNNLKYLGNKYFVGLKYVYNNPRGYDFPFNLSKSNVSFVEGMTWNLTGTCGVEVKNSYYIPNPNNSNCTIENCNASLSYIFRPISLINPFPKYERDGNKIAINWRNWYLDSLESSSRNNGRLNALSFSKKEPEYLIKLSRFQADDAVKISKIKSYSLANGTYDKLEGYNIDGSSYFVNEFFNESNFIKADSSSYCSIGYFYDECDEW